MCEISKRLEINLREGDPANQVSMKANILYRINCMNVRYNPKDLSKGCEKIDS